MRFREQKKSVRVAVTRAISRPGYRADGCSFFSTTPITVQRSALSLCLCRRLAPAMPFPMFDAYG